VPRIFKRIRPAFRYERSLDVLTRARAFGLVTKSDLILGMGETRAEAIKTMWDTGRDMSTKYKETARGGLAVNVIEC